MIKIKIFYTAQLKKAVGVREEILELEAAEQVKGILLTLNEKHKEAFRNIVFDAEGKFLHAVLLSCNGKQLDYESGLLLSDSDELTIMSPIAGG